MRTIIGERGSGKTEELIRMSNKYWAYIVCADRNRVDLVAKRAKEMRIDIPFPITFDNFEKGSYRANPPMNLLIDDVDDYVKFVARRNRGQVLAITITGKDEQQ